MVDLEVRVDPRTVLKASTSKRFTGTSVARVDLPDKVAGRARFIHDLRLRASCSPG